ncbi:ZrgA family zinc uptake protein [Endozoicomonas acroporae]|uniref:ZrgA family zinc uptake protein n=1 Tax=Endozoicomonas acroporae TaxID=1701104 RepID=UPI003D7B916C
MRCVAKVAAVACALITAGVSADGHRHAGAHVHGAGYLNFAIEGRQVHIELETPGFDILGFESIRSDAQRRQLKDALQELEKDDLWSFTPAASCTLKAASASASGEHGEDHHDHHGDADGHHDSHHHSHGHDDHHGDGHHESAHMDIAATYVYECANIAGLNSISTRLFQRFANSEQLKVQGFTDAGQIAGQMSRERPEVRF